VLLRRGSNAVNVADLIRKLGFRRWYERQLIEGHLYLVTGVLALVMFAAGLELMGDRQTFADLVFDSVLIMAGVAAAWYAWRRYSSAMILAEWVGEQAICPSCRHEGFRAIPVGELPVEHAATPHRQVLASCRKCNHYWRIDPGV
jgi:hypothetical protein